MSVEDRSAENRPGEDLPKAILLMGPTAAGKTDLAIELAARYPIDIISVDSALVYRSMDIGTGKPSPDQLQRFPHHLVNILDPSETYSAGQFARDASALIAASHARQRVPLLVGGTMLYFRALLRGIAEMPTANSAFRTLTEQRAAKSGWSHLHAELADLDPRAAGKIGRNDSQRIQRALEVIHLTGRPMSEVQAEARPPLPHVQFVTIGLNPTDREVLYGRIEARFHQMMAAGFLSEARDLYQRGDLHSELPAIRAVGYRQLWQHLEGTCSLDEAIAHAILATRHLARRQLVWMRAEPALQWVDGVGLGALSQVIDKTKHCFG
jgi:tRNA dimethylallyltransferase